MSVKKYLLIALTMASVFTSCQGIIIGAVERIILNDKLKNDSMLWVQVDTSGMSMPEDSDDLFPRPAGVYNQDILKGNYIVAYMSMIKPYDERFTGQDVAHLEHEYFLSPLLIGDSVITYATSEYPMQFHQTHWKYEDKNTLVSDTGVFKEISIIDTSEGNLFAQVVINYKNKPAWFSVSFNRVTKADMALLLDKTKNQWREAALNNESDKAIKARLKSLLSYSANYIRAVRHADITTLHTEKFLLPFKYYNGGMEISEIYENGNFDRVFYDNTDAAKAYDMLKTAYMQCLREYPSRENYLVEYADFIDIVNKKI